VGRGPAAGPRAPAAAVARPLFAFPPATGFGHPPAVRPPPRTAGGRGAWFECRFPGTRVVYLTGPENGQQRPRVFLDDLAAPVRERGLGEVNAYGVVAFDSGELPPGDHVLRVEGGDAETLALDCLLVDFPAGR
jgi:hypothetical protein